MHFGVGHLRAIAQWKKRGPDSAADPADPRYREQWNMPPGSETDPTVHRMRAYDRGQAVVRETATHYHVDTAKPLPPLPAGGVLRLAQRALNGLQPPPAPRSLPKSEVTVAQTDRGLVKFTPNNPQERPFIGRPEASLAASADQTPREQLQQFKDVWATRRWGQR